MSSKKVCYIVRGLPGSGKSLGANQLSCTHMVSADFYFMRGMEYKFDPTKIGEAHAQCKRNFIYAITENMESAFGSIVVDNTNTTVLEMAPYVEIAMAFGYDVKIVEFQCSVETSMKRNTHGVPESAIRYMAQNLQTYDAPPWWPARSIIETD